MILTHRGMIIKAESWNEEKAIALLLRDGHPSPLGEGPGVRVFLAQAQNTQYHKYTKTQTDESIKI